MDGASPHRMVNLVYVFSITAKMDRIYGVKVAFTMLSRELFSAVCVMQTHLNVIACQGFHSFIPLDLQHPDVSRVTSSKGEPCTLLGCPLGQGWLWGKHWIRHGLYLGRRG